METNVSSLLNLNDDCLDVIFKHMKIEDQINLAGCCCRLRDVFVMRVKVEHRILYLNDLKSLLASRQLRNFFQMAGPHIQKLIGCWPMVSCETVNDFIGIYCINVRSISMRDDDLSGDCLRKLLRNAYPVEELNLGNVELKDNSIPVLKKLKNLKKLSLDKNKELTGREIQCLTTVHDLSLNWCEAIEPIFFKRICENLKDLKYLDIQGCSSLQESSMLDIVEHLHKLETIKLSYYNDKIGCIAKLPSLKKIHLDGRHKFGTEQPQIFKELAKHKADQLEVLSICRYIGIDLEKVTSIIELSNLKELICPNSHKLTDNCLQNLSKLHELELLDIEDCIGFTGMGLLDLIQNCRKLKTLNISKCKRLDEKFATRLLDLLIAERNQRNQNTPLKLIASLSGIPRSAVKSPEFEEASDILTFDSNDYYMDDISDPEYSDNDDYMDDSSDLQYSHSDDYNYYQDSDDYDPDVAAFQDEFQDF